MAHLPVDHPGVYRSRDSFKRSSSRPPRVQLCPSLGQRRKNREHDPRGPEDFEERGQSRGPVPTLWETGPGPVLESPFLDEQKRGLGSCLWEYSTQGTKEERTQAPAVQGPNLEGPWATPLPHKSPGPWGPVSGELKPPGPTQLPPPAQGWAGPLGSGRPLCSSWEGVALSRAWNPGIRFWGLG